MLAYASLCGWFFRATAARVEGMPEWQPASLQSAICFRQRSNPMKHLLNGVAIAAALTIAGPVWAQTTAAPMTPSSRAAPSTSTAAPMEPMASTGHKMRMHRTARHHTVMRRGTSRRGSADDNVANQLNAQELGRAGSSAPARAPGMAPGMSGPYGQPSQIQGMPGAGQPSASAHAPTGPGPAYVPGQFQPSPSPNAPAQMR